MTTARRRSQGSIVLGVLKLCRNMLSVHHQFINAGGVDVVRGTASQCQPSNCAVAATVAMLEMGPPLPHQCRSFAITSASGVFLLAASSVSRRHSLEKMSFITGRGSNLLHMPGVRVAGQCERAAPFRFVAFKQIGWVRRGSNFRCGLLTSLRIVADWAKYF